MPRVQSQDLKTNVLIDYNIKKLLAWNFRFYCVPFYDGKCAPSEE